MPKPKLKKIGEVHGPRKEEFDTSVFTSAQDLVWLQPDNMIGIPSRNVEGGRLACDVRLLARTQV